MSIDKLRAATGQAQQEGGNAFQLFVNQLERSKPQLLGLMNNDKNNVEKFCSVLQRAVLGNMTLLDADRKSLLAAALKCGQDGLLPDGREAVLNIRNTKIKQGNQYNWIKLVVYEPMVAGYIKNLYEHPDVKMVDAAAVYANDHFKFVRGDSPKLEHEPVIVGDPGELIAAYVCVKLASGEIKREVMPKRDIEKVRAASSNTSDSEKNPWVSWGDQMAIKSVIKRAAKQLPKSNKFESMDRHDNEALTLATQAGDTALPTGTPAAAGALTHNPSDVLEQPLPHGDAQGEPLPVEAGAADEANTLRTRDGAEEVGADEAFTPPVLTYAQLEQRLRGTSDEAVAALVLDEARSILSDEENKQLAAIYSAMYESAAPSTKKSGK